MIVRPWSENIWFSPCYIINELGKAAARKESLKKYKEAWVCAVALICYSKVHPVEWWMQVPREDPPDVLGMYFVDREDGLAQDMLITRFEIFEISAFDNEKIEESIRRKLGEKDYSGMTLIGFVRRTVIFNHFDVSDIIKKLNPKISSLLLIVREENGTNTSLIELFPECVKLKEDFGLFCKTTKQRSFMDVKRGSKSVQDPITTIEQLSLVPS